MRITMLNPYGLWPEEEKPKATKVTDKNVMNQYEVFTDGSCHPNPGPGGWGVVIQQEGRPEIYLKGGQKRTTNNQMELMAAICALENFKEKSVITISTDSKYVRDGITKWINGWKRNGFKAYSGKPVKNRDLWERLDRARGKHIVNWKWIKGHNGHRENEIADELARRGRIEL